MVNNSTNINKNHLSPKLIEWWSTIPPISTKITSHFNSLNDGQQFNSMSLGERWFLLILVELLTITNINKNTPLTITHWEIVNNSTNINNNHFSPQLIKWWSTIPPPISTKNHPSIQLIEWWSTIPPISTKITSHLNSLSDGQQFHSMSWIEGWFFVDIGGGIVDHHSVS